MDYCAENLGIRVSDDNQKCWVIEKEDNEWRCRGDAFPVSALREYATGIWSGLDVALNALKRQNPTERDKVLALIQEKHHSDSRRLP